MTKLSICIPTYNRSSCLCELLESIIAQGLPEIEVVVSDDASPDDTAEIMESYRTRLERLVFLRQPRNIGLDQNFIEVVKAATGDYVWLMGDDDRLEPGAGLRVLQALERWPNVVGLTVGVIDYDPTMQRATGIRAMPESRLLTGVSEVFSTISELLGFMSAMVVDRRRWERAGADSSVRQMNNLYSQVYIVGLALGKAGTWGVVKEFCVGFRSDNDQFKRKLGWFERLKVDVRAYDEIADRLLKDDKVAHRTMRERIFNTHVMARLVNSKTEIDPKASSGRVALYLASHYGAMPRLWTRGFPVLLAPKGVLNSMRKVYKKFGKSSGASRARQIETKQGL